MEPSSIEEMYPPVPVAMLVSDEWQRRFRQDFLDSGELAADPFEVTERTTRPHRKCFAMSLFRVNSNNRTANQYPLDRPYWRRKYWDGFLGIVGELPGFPEWKLRLYLEAGMWDAIPAVLAEHPQIELYRMAVDSVGASPGVLWRYLALADASLDVVLATDIDEPLGEKAAFIRAFEAADGAAVGRLGGFTSGGRYLIDPPRSRAKNYATVLGGRVMSRPARWDFDPAAVMRGFMAHRRCVARTDRPWRYAADEPPSAYNEPIGGHEYGWGSHWYIYGFDERFLKHVVYYHFADAGRLHTSAAAIPPHLFSPEGACDLRYTHARGNPTTCPHTGAASVPAGP